ncbi:MAG: MarR family transcriptional regulator [Acidimicrobiales bacterium]
MASRPDRDALADEAWASLLSYFLARRQVFVRVAVEFELTPGDLHALVSLDPDEPKPMKALAETFRCDPSNATWMVDRLEQRGIVERRTATHDRRVRAVAVTSDGVVLRNKVLSRLGEPPAEFATLTDDELEALRCALAKLGSTAR